MNSTICLLFLRRGVGVMLTRQYSQQCSDLKKKNCLEILKKNKLPLGVTT